MKNGKRRHSGFSRTELVLVVGATGFLTALWLPATAQNGLFGVFQRARENARRASCQSNLKQVSLGLIMYTQDYDELYPPATSQKTNSYDGFGWSELIQPYLKTTQVYQCPSEKHAAATTPNPKLAGYTDYWLNARFSRLGFDKVSAPAQSITLGDGDGGSANSSARYHLMNLPTSWAKFQDSPSTRHVGGANYAFADGHVKWFLPQDIRSTPLKQSGGKPTMAIR